MWSVNGGRPFVKVFPTLMYNFYPKYRLMSKCMNGCGSWRVAMTKEEKMEWKWFKKAVKRADDYAEFVDQLMALAKVLEQMVKDSWGSDVAVPLSNTQRRKLLEAAELLKDARY
jgi:hypothetical protein